MDGLTGIDDAHDLANEIRGVNVMARCRSRRTMSDDATTALGPDHGKRGGSRMGATLAAARYVDGIAVRWNMLRQLRRKRS
jgi:hypothetical protein